MKIIKILTLLVVLLFAFSLSSCANKEDDVIDNTNEKVMVNAKTLNKALIASTYLLGDTFTAPNVKLSYDGKEYDAKAYVKFPSGKITENSAIKLNEAGLYEVNYLAQGDDKTLYKKYTFVVTNELYSLTGGNSSAYYGTHEYMPDTKGIITKIHPNETFVYNKPIDLSAYNQNNKILTFNVLPNTIGKADAQKIVIKLTDIYDSENFITLELKKYDDNKLAYAENTTFVTAYGNGQASIGLELGRHLGVGTVIQYNGKKYAIHKNNSFGAWIDFSLPGAPRFESSNLPNYDAEYVGEQEFSVAMDYENGIVYGGPDLILVNDLRSSLVYGSNFWTGFTTGEVYLSISATNYNAESVNLIIKNIADESTANMIENLYADTKAPSLDILWEGDYPTALIDSPYPIFPVNSYDDYDRENKLVTTSVYLNYGLPNQINVNIKDGCFIPQYQTTYYIKYEVVDKSGNKNEKVIPINVSDNVDKIAVDGMSDVPNTFDVGSIVTIKDLEYKNVVGQLVEKKTATLKNDPSIVYEIKGNTFIPLYAGEYEINYEYSDYLFNNNYSYDITVNQTNKPLIYGDVIELKDYYIKGCEYLLPTYSGYIFKDGKPIESNLDIYVTEGDKVTKLVDNKYVPNYDGEVTISYVLSNNGVESRRDIKVNSVDVGYDSSLVMGKYFFGDNFTINAESKFIEYVFTDNKNTNLDFINALPSKNFSIRLGASEGKDHFAKIHLYLTDAADEKIKIRFTYEKEPNGYVKFYINDEASTAYDTFFASNDNPIIFEYSDKTKQVSPHPASYQMIKQTLYGEPFNGFVSDKVYLSIQVEGLNGESALRITNVCGQPFTKVKADIIEPKVYVSNDLGDHDINSIYTLEAANIADVLDPNISAFVRVKDPDGQIVSTIDGLVLDKGIDYSKDHQFMLTKYGLYQVYYEAIDSNENMTTYTYVINVVDKEIPVVELVEPVTSGKVGEVINIANVKIKDNHSKEFTVYVCLVDPSGVAHTLTDLDEVIVINKSFVTQVAGKYKVCYYVADEAGNMAILSYEIIVE